MVVALIIALLAVIVIVGYNSSRVSARDARRKSDLTNLASALREYYVQNNSYPATLAGLAGTYVDKVPADPSGGTATYTYADIAKTSTAPEYVVLHATMESASNNVGGYTTTGNDTGGLTCANGTVDYCVKLQY
jgi:Tfp pilus assembly protein PilE